MITLRALLLAAAVALPAVPAFANDADALAARHHAPPSRLSEAQRGEYRLVFAAIRAADWAGAEARLRGLGQGPLHNAALAELYLAPGSPPIEPGRLLELLARAPDLPQAAQIARLARSRGVETLPDLPQAARLAGLSGQPRRARADATKGDQAAAELEGLIQPLIKADQPGQAEALLGAREGELSRAGLTEYQQRIAWSYYLTNNDGAARRLADKARSGSGEWVIHAEWLAGLAAWRMRDCEAAGIAFGNVAIRSTDMELTAAGHYWAARADMLCGRPERVQPRLRSAARLGETFYGLLSSSALGVEKPTAGALHDFRDAEWAGIAVRPNVVAAIALAEIGERGHADTFIKHEARIASGNHNALLHLAADLNLAGTQFWLAHNAPRGTSVNVAARYPAPDWRPARGWRVDKSLAFAHALQESNFRTQVISPAGASGLMQVRPGTAGDFARARGEPFSPQQLSEPAVNLEYGQSFIELLRDHHSTGGLLPKVIAAYNAGPVPIAAWNGRRIDGGDPLLYIESIPYWETRGYVPIVLRNYWIYEQQAGKDSASRAALAQGMWPRFPGLPGATAVRLTGSSATSQQGTE